MEALSEIKENIRKIASPNGGGELIFTAQVKEVAADGETCTVETDGLEVGDVRLRAVVNGEESKVIITPKVGSYVLVADLFRDFTKMIVIGYSEVDKVEINCDNVVFNGGDNSGIIKIEELTQKLNELVNKFNAHTHFVETSGTAAAQSGTTQPTANSASRFNKSDYEDSKITH